MYLADDTTLRRRVALKVLHAGLASDQGFIKRFQAEARTAAALAHPNIMRVLDWGETEDGSFLVLEYLGGGSLRGVLDAQPTLSLSQAAQIGLQAARGLEYAHRRGLVHRDIKPANLLFDDEGRLAIADFGLARALAEAAWTEPGGAVLGTARYASPEQVRGNSLDGKADVYALGLVLFEVLTGTVPFSADTTLATLMARLDEFVEVPESFGVLREIVAAATHPDFEQRIDSAELVRRLEEAVSALPAAEKFELPGAVMLDLTSPVAGDPTMLPSAGDVRPTVLDEQPMPTAPRRSLLPWKRGANPYSPEQQSAKQSITRPAPTPVVPQASPEPDMSTDQSPDQGETKKRRRPSKKAFLIGLLLVVLLAGASGGGYALFYYTGRQVPVPQLEGLTLDGARSAARTANIRLSYDGTAFNETVPTGQTFAQSPAIGTAVRPHEPVHLKVSKGPAPRKLTDFTGQQVETAQAELEKQGLSASITKKSDESAPVGRILDQSPKTGEVDKGSEIGLTISSGPAPRIVPDLSGKTYEQAVAVLAEMKLKVSRTEGFSDSVPAGQVSGSTPGPGASVGRDTTIAVIVSKGPDLVAVPDVSGKSSAVASNQLSDAGFVPNVFGPGGNVITTKPSAGTKVKRGSVVAIYIG